MSSSSKDKKNSEANAKILQELLKEPENRYCADCNSKGPRWASWTLGVFVCIRCSGIHRSLGVHISKVKSVTLDAWTDEQITSISNIGNEKAKELYEYNVPKSYRRPDETSDNYAVEQWIRAKYERKDFMKRSTDPDRSSDTDRSSPNGSSNSKSVENNNETKSTNSPRTSAPRRQNSQQPRNNNGTPSAKSTSNVKTATDTMASDDIITLDEPVHNPQLPTSVNYPSLYPPAHNSAPSGQATGMEFFAPGDPSSTTPRALSKNDILKFYNAPVAPTPTPGYIQQAAPNYYGYPPQAGYPQYQYPAYPPATTFTPGVGYTVAGYPSTYGYASNGQWKQN